MREAIRKGIKYNSTEVPAAECIVNIGIELDPPSTLTNRQILCTVMYTVGKKQFGGLL